jgi:hypothetical protein
MKRLIEAFEYEEIDARGPAHLPVFTVVAWADVPGQGRIRGIPAEAANKKLAQRLAADRLIERLKPLIVEPPPSE